jgi:putative oxidoreductase
MLENNDLGKLIIRLSLGFMLLFHGIHKLLNISGTVGWMGQMLAAHHLPSFIAYGVFVGEIIAPLMLIVGYYSRISGLLITINMLIAIFLVHMGELFTLNGQGGWALELQGFYLLMALALVFLGGGKYGMNRH